MRAGHFREDLLYRLNVIEIRVPALRDRREDILPLARRFLAFFTRKSRRHVPELSPAAAEMLVNYTWPGNVRELRNAIERAAILWPAPIIEPAAFPERLAGRGELGGRTWAAASRSRRSSASTSCGCWRAAQTFEDAARILGVDASTLWRKRKKYDEAAT